MKKKTNQERLAVFDWFSKQGGFGVRIHLFRVVGGLIRVKSMRF